LQPSPEFDDAFRAQLHELFRWRRDVRHFLRDPLPEGSIERLVTETALSPSVGYSQPWRFVRVRSQERRDAVIASFERANAEALASYANGDALLYARLKLAGLREAPEHLAVFCDASTTTGRGLGRNTMPQMLSYSATMAVYTFWLAARAAGIGVGWVSILEPQTVREVLMLPQDWDLIAYLCVGYPSEDRDAPELAREGWERSDERAVTIYDR
jgi:5,6-dimethylbenzimidazole synthase